MIGRSISHYKILQKLGEGGMGVVYKAHDTKLKRDVAIKFLPSHITTIKEDQERFTIEAQAAARLNHPNIATIYSIEEVDGEIFFVMEYIDGKELKEEIASAPLPIDTIVDIGLQTARGLQAAHLQGIVHRDMKSSNIMITRDGRVKIMDFGLAKIRGGTQLTKTGTTLGTVSYMSPEQVRGEEADERSDIWSFGVVLYEMVSGRLPFQGDFEAAVIYTILNDAPKPVGELRPDAPAALRQIVTRAMAKDRRDRYASIDQILNDLQGLRPASGKTPSLSISTLVRKPRFVALGILILAIISFLVITSLRKRAEFDFARRELLPRIDSLAAQLVWTGEGSAAWTAFALASDAERLLPDDPVLKGYWPKVSVRVSLHSDPPGANVFAKCYGDTGMEWRYFGKTPLDSLRFPRGFSRVKLELSGTQPVEDLFWALRNGESQSYTLLSTAQLPEGMVLVEGESRALRLPGLDHLKTEPVQRFFVDRYEVTNRAYKRFVDAGGYSDPAYWKYPFFKDGRTLSWDQAMSLFKDKTGRLGPATWEVGDYPEGKDNYPVTGVSWYEAAAFAAFVGKDLPTIFHWNLVAFTWASGVVIPASNFNGERLAAVGSYPGMTRYGTFDLAGNAREWAFNESSQKGHHFILGGGWNDRAYAFNDAYTQESFDRSPTNGFRCMKYLDTNENQQALARIIEMVSRDFTREKPVAQGTFDLFVRQYDYDRTPLNPRVETTDDSQKDWVEEKVTFEAGYGGERVTAYLYLPKNIPPPYQTIVFFPPDLGFGMRSPSTGRVPFAHFLKSGRAFLQPVYKGTFERGDELESSMPNESTLYKEHVVMWSKDMRRSIDYLETRKDIDIHRLAYYGLSWGGRMAPIMLALEHRFRTAILNVAGLRFQKARPEVDPFNFLPRVTLPVLMLNGRHDFYFPYETSQKPFFELLGTPANRKKWLVYDGSHIVPTTELVRESLTWLDTFMGPVRE